MNCFNTGLTFTPEGFILCKKVWGPRGPRGMGAEIFDILQPCIIIPNLS